MRGGYRFFAGRQGWRNKVEQSLFVDIRSLYRKGLLKPNNWFSWSWTNSDGEKAGSITIHVPTDCKSVAFKYRWTPYNAETRDVQCDIDIDRTRCNYGGSRVWFVCPRCNRRCAYVYFGAPGGKYACRRCLNLAYISEGLDWFGRDLRRLEKHEAKLGPDGEKPKGMHWRTYKQLLDAR